MQMANWQALDLTTRPLANSKERCFVNFDIVMMLCKPLRIVLTPLEYEKKGIFEIAKGPGWHRKPVKLNLKKARKIKKVIKVKKVLKVKKVSKIKMVKKSTRTIDVTKSSKDDDDDDDDEDLEIFNRRNDSVLENNVEPIPECIESVVDDNRNVTKPSKKLTPSHPKKSAIPAAKKNRSKTPAVIVANKDKTGKTRANEKTILELPVLQHVLHQDNGALLSSDDDFMDNFVPSYGDISSDEDLCISSKVDDPLPRNEVNITPRDDSDVLTVAPNTNPENEQKLYKCNNCELSFFHEQQFRKHELTHYPEDIVQPADCNIEKETPDEFEKQFKEPRKKKIRRGKEVLLGCQFCSASFTHRKTLNNHEAAHINKQEFNYYCDVRECNAGFVEKSAFDYHKRLGHTPKKTYPCKVCGISFKTNPTLKIHSRVHSNDKPYKCNKCEQAFKHKNSLVFHVSQHYRSKDFSCKFCSESFFTNNEMRVHSKKAHPAEFEKGNERKKFICDTCGAIFTTNNSLKNHLNMHTGNRPYLCDKCPQSYMHPTSLKYHKMHNLCGKIKIPCEYRCEECGEIFTVKRFLERHVKKFHTGPEILNCEVCGKVLKRPFLTAHMKTHVPAVKKEFKCNKCPFIADYKCHLKRHMQIKHSNEKPYKCKLCPAEFRCYITLKKHKATHNNNNSINVVKNPDFKNKEQIEGVETSSEQIVYNPNLPLMKTTTLML